MKINFLCISDRHKTCRDCSATIPLSVQQILILDVFPIVCYEPLNVQYQIGEQCTFYQIQSHAHAHAHTHTHTALQNLVSHCI